MDRGTGDTEQEDNLVDMHVEDKLPLLGHSFEDSVDMKTAEVEQSIQMELDSQAVMMD